MMSTHEINLLVEKYIGTTPDGYLMHFSYSKHERFYPLYCDLDINVPAYRAKGHTTRTGFIQILKDASPSDQAKIIRGVFEMIPPPEEADDDDAREKRSLYKELLAVADRLDIISGQVATPPLLITSETVNEALKDAETLLKTRGPKSAVDRAHTALHGYLKRLCQERGEILPDDPSLTYIFKILREKFPEFATNIPYDSEAKKVFGSVASALDSLNTIRNRATLAHPNELLLDAPEAMLFINLSWAVLAYVEAKIKKQ